MHAFDRILEYQEAIRVASGWNIQVHSQHAFSFYEAHASFGHFPVDPLIPPEESDPWHPDLPPDFDPTAPDSQREDEFQDLAQAWDVHATLCPHGGRELRVSTWYVHHQRVPLGRFCRTVRLSHAWRSWKQVLYNRWSDLIALDEEWFFVVVYPAPFEPSVDCLGIHVILWQGSPGPRRVGLSSTRYMPFRTAPSLLAWSIPETVDAFTLSRYGEVALPNAVPSHVGRSIFAGNGEPITSERVSIDDGFAWQLWIGERETSHVDTLSLLQTDVQSRRVNILLDEALPQEALRSHTPVSCGVDIFLQEGGFSVGKDLPLDTSGCRSIEFSPYDSVWGRIHMADLHGRFHILWPPRKKAM